MPQSLYLEGQVDGTVICQCRRHLLLGQSVRRSFVVDGEPRQRVFDDACSLRSKCANPAKASDCGNLWGCNGEAAAVLERSLAKRVRSAAKIFSIDVVLLAAASRGSLPYGGRRRSCARRFSLSFISTIAGAGPCVGQQDRTIADGISAAAGAGYDWAPLRYARQVAAILTHIGLACTRADCRSAVPIWARPDLRLAALREWHRGYASCWGRFPERLLIRTMPAVAR